LDSLYYSIVEDDLGLDSTIETELLKALRSENRQALNSKFLLSSRDQQGELIGGLSASTSYGWVLIELVWVSEEARGAGIGSALIRAAERKARSLNCHAAWLETSSASVHRLAKPSLAAKCFNAIRSATAS